MSSRRWRLQRTMAAVAATISAWRRRLRRLEEGCDRNPPSPRVDDILGRIFAAGECSIFRTRASVPLTRLLGCGDDRRRWRRRRRWRQRRGSSGDGEAGASVAAMAAAAARRVRGEGGARRVRAEGGARRVCGEGRASWRFGGGMAAAAARRVRGEGGARRMRAEGGVRDVRAEGGERRARAEGGVRRVRAEGGVRACRRACRSERAGARRDAVGGMWRQRRRGACVEWAARGVCVQRAARRARVVR